MGTECFLSFFYENQVRKEADKTAVTKVVVAADKAKEQELKSRTREVITAKQEQTHITQEQVKVVFDLRCPHVSVQMISFVFLTLKQVNSKATCLVSHK